MDTCQYLSFEHLVVNCWSNLVFHAGNRQHSNTRRRAILKR